MYQLIIGSEYGIFMIACIVISIVPMAFKSEPLMFTVLDYCTAAVFLFDYIARWVTADFGFSGLRNPFWKYPIQPIAVIDLLSILPSVRILNDGFRLLKLFRLMRTLKVMRAFKLVRYSKNLQIILNVFRKQRDALLAVLWLAAAYILVSALVVFNVEPDTFSDFFEAIYWATVSLTTMGYGDIYPVSPAGRVVTMLSSLFGIAIIALPAGIVTAGYMEEITKEESQ